MSEPEGTPSTTWPAIPGFRFAGLASGIKPGGKRDLALAVAGDAAVAAAGVFTQNRLCAAPVQLTRARLGGGHARAVLVNSGNANAATGEAGHEAAERSTALVAAALGCEAAEMLVASTGVIGVPLPMAPFEANSRALVDALDEHGLSDFAHAILTTDRWPKLAQTTLRIGDAEAPVVGVAKGAGMIHPDMATTLAFVFTSAQVTSAQLAAALGRATDLTFNRITVDGDTSTNDTILLFASGQSSLVVRDEADARALTESLVEVLDALGRLIVSDGEGAEHCVTIRVEGAASDADAVQVARTVATSPLVKTALHGCDPNWGRILAAAGRAGVDFDPEAARVSVGGFDVYDRAPSKDPELEAEVSAAMREPTYDIVLDLRAGDGTGHYVTSDLGHAYVELNADYRT